MPTSTLLRDHTLNAIRLLELPGTDMSTAYGQEKFTESLESSFARIKASVGVGAIPASYVALQMTRFLDIADELSRLNDVYLSAQTEIKRKWD